MLPVSFYIKGKYRCQLLFHFRLMIICFLISNCNWGTILHYYWHFELSTTYKPLILTWIIYWSNERSQGPLAYNNPNKMLVRSLPKWWLYERIGWTWYDRLGWDEMRWIGWMALYYQVRWWIGRKLVWNLKFYLVNPSIPHCWTLLLLLSPPTITIHTCTPSKSNLSTFWDCIVIHSVNFGAAFECLVIYLCVHIGW